MGSEATDEYEEGAEADDAQVRLVTLAPEEAGGRIDKALAAGAPDLSRGRIQALMAEGRVSLAGLAVPRQATICSPSRPRSPPSRSRRRSP